MYCAQETHVKYENSYIKTKMMENNISYKIQTKRKQCGSLTSDKVDFRISSVIRDKAWYHPLHCDKGTVHQKTKFTKKVKVYTTYAWSLRIHKSNRTTKES